MISRQMMDLLYKNRKVEKNKNTELINIKKLINEK